jgi:hypothetical protein
MNIFIENQDMEDLFVSVQDLNTANAKLVLDNQRINRGQSSQADIQPDGNGTGNIHWRVTQAIAGGKTSESDATPSAGDTVGVST